MDRKFPLFHIWMSQSNEYLYAPLFTLRHRVVDGREWLRLFDWFTLKEETKKKGSGDHTDRELSNLILRCNFSRWLHRNVEVLFLNKSPLAFLKQLSNSSHSLDWRAFSKIGDYFTSYFLTKKNRLTSFVIYLSLTLIEATWLLSRVSHDLRILREPLTPLKVEAAYRRLKGSTLDLPVVVTAGKRAAEQYN